MNLAGLRCLVLGGGGFIGTNLCLALMKSGAEVEGFGPPPRAEPRLSRLTWRNADFRDSARLQAAVVGKDVVYHLLGRATPASSNALRIADLQENLIPSLHLLDLCRQAGVGRLIFGSSGGTVYGKVDRLPIAETAPTQPITAYGIGKLAFEYYLALEAHAHGLRAISLRMSNPYGPHQYGRRGQGLIGAALAKALSGEAIEIWGDGTVIRDFVHIDDVVRAMLLCAVYEGSEQVFNLGSGTGRTVREVIDTIADVTALPPGRIRYLAGRKEDVSANVLDISRIERELDWRPTVDWQSGIASTAQWMESALRGSSRS